MSYIEYFDSRTALLAAGRKRNIEEGKSWIPSIEEWQRALNRVHSAAKKGCPFAIATITECESKLVEIRTLVEENRAVLKEKMDNSLIQVTEPDVPRKYQVKIDLEKYMPFTINALECLATMDRLKAEYFMVSGLGEAKIRYWRREFAMITMKYRSLKHFAFRYKDEGIRSFEYKGTLEWDACVDRLGKEPKKQSYDPYFYMRSEDLPAELVVESNTKTGVESSSVSTSRAASRQDDGEKTALSYDVTEPNHGIA